MKQEQLLAPRYEVIADYPGSNFTVGNIINASELNDMSMWLEVMGKKWVDNKLSMFGKYPAIFRRLNWWEKRESSEMPEYVKYTIRGFVFKYKDHLTEDGRLVYGEYGFSLSSCLPATLEEYTNYINKSK